jgi:hypothetical protein
LYPLSLIFFLNSVRVSSVWGIFGKERGNGASEFSEVPKV